MGTLCRSFYKTFNSSVASFSRQYCRNVPYGTLTVLTSKRPKYFGTRKMATLDSEPGTEEMTDAVQKTGSTDREEAGRMEQGENMSNLSKRAKRRQARMEMVKKKGNQKELKRLKRLADPNADQSRGFSQHIFGETDYYFENGLRKVYPYHYTFTAFAKRRWVGRSLIDVFSAEFRADTEDYYKVAIESGAMTVNGNVVSPDYKLCESDLIENRIHRHENPVTDRPVEVIHEDSDVFVVNKPSSIPCHPCGRYRFNSAVFILGKEMKQPNLRNIYRLDRLTSGVMVCGKTAKRTCELEKHVLNREVEKEYVCRVVGEFPDGRINVDKPVDVLSNRVSVWKVSANGKPSQTFFEKMSYDGKSSVVKCFPKTGRTHQIRVHLQYLGYPIVNDPIYNSTAFGALRGKGGDFGRPDSEVIKEIERIHNVGEWEEGVNPLFVEKMKEKEGEKSQHVNSDVCTAQTDCGNVNVNTEEVSDKRGGVEAEKSDSGPAVKRVKLSPSGTDERPGFDLEKWKPDMNCRSCRTKYLDPSPSNLIMYLHALRYKGPDWDYQTELPDWARADFVEGENS